MSNRLYKVIWTYTALDELARIKAYPSQVKRTIYLDSLNCLSFWPTASARKITSGELKGLWARLGKYNVTLLFDIDEESV